MPRVAINKKQYMLKDFCHWISDRMREEHLNQTAAGRFIGVSQQVFSQKMRESRFTLEEVITLLHELKATPEEAVKLMIY